MSMSMESLTDAIERAGPDRVLPADSLYTSDPEGAVRIRVDREWPGNRNPVSLPTVVRR
jgi:hypothetical protein